MSDPTPEAPPSSHEELVGQELDGKYQIERVVGVGGMAAVYEAKVKDSTQRCAIKVLLAETVADDPATLERFRREAAIARKLKSPNVVEFLGYGKLPDGRPYLAMEFLEGEGLDIRVSMKGPISLAQAVHVLLGVEAALTPAHALNIVHRDLKPGNIFLAKQADGSEVVKLLDFGASKLHSSKLQDLTSRGLVIGTADYMSPEQARGQKLDPRSDIFSLGIVLFELLTGRRPFEASRPVDILFRICSDPVPSMRTLVPGLPPELDVVLARAMAKPAAARYDTVKEFVDAVQAVLATQGQAQAQPVLTPPRVPAQGAPQRPTTGSGRRSKRTRAKITGAPVPGADPFEAMVFAGLLTREALEATRAEVGPGPALVQALVDRGLVGEVELLRVFAALKNARYARLEKAARVNPQPDVLSTFGAERARRYRVLPFSRNSAGELQALVAVPVEPGAEEELGRAFGATLQLILTSPAAVEAAHSRWLRSAPLGDPGSGAAPERPTTGERKRRGTRKSKSVEATPGAPSTEPSVLLASAASAEPPTTVPVAVPPAAVPARPAPTPAPIPSDARPRSQVVMGGALPPVSPPSPPRPPSGQNPSARPPSAPSLTPARPAPPPAPAPVPPRPAEARPATLGMTQAAPRAVPPPGAEARPLGGASQPGTLGSLAAAPARPASLAQVAPVRPSSPPSEARPPSGAVVRPDSLGAKLVTQTLATSAEVLGADRMALVLPNGTVHAHPPNLASPEAIPPGVLSQAGAVTGGVLIGDAATDYRFQASTSPLLEGVKTAMAIPLLHEGSRFGVLFAGATRSTPFRATDLQRLALVAAQASLGLALHAQAEALRRDLAQRASAPPPAPAPAPEPHGGASQPEPDIRPASGLATVLCAEVVEVPLASEKLPPERLLRSLNQLLEDVAAAISASGGRVDRHLGAGLLAVWNQPASCPDHAQKALEAARKVLDCAAAFTFQGQALTLRVGVHTGPVTVGRLGAARRFSEGTVGPAVLGALRLGALAPGQVVASQETLNQAGMAFLSELVALPAQELGLGPPVVPYAWAPPRAAPAFRVELGV